MAIAMYKHLVPDFLKKKIGKHLLQMLRISTNLHEVAVIRWILQSPQISSLKCP